MTQPRIVRTAEEFAAVEDDTLVVSVEFRHHDFRVRKLWQNFSGQYLEMDPADRSDGEEVREALYMQHLLTGFGSRDTIPGVGLVLGEGEPIAHDQLEQLPMRSFIRVPGGPSDDEIYEYNGGGKWMLMDPSDRWDGEFSTPTAALTTPGIRVIYRPGDEDLVA